MYAGCGNATGDVLVFSLDDETGAIEPRASVASGSSTSFAALHPSGRFLYTTQNRADRLTAFAVEGDGLRRLNDVAIRGIPGAEQSGPAHVAVDGSGRWLLAANYRGHNVVVFALGADGRIGAQVASASAGTHAHFACLDPSNRFLFVPFLGADVVAQYRFDAATGALAPNDPPAMRTPAGEGPRHLAFHPDGRRGYLLTELGASVFACNFDERAGTLVPFQQIAALPADYTGRRWAADIHVHPSGRFVYASNRAHDSLAAFAVDATSGRLTLIGFEPTRGQTPRSFQIDPSGRFLVVANQDSGTLATFAIDPATGRLTHLATQPAGENLYFVLLARIRHM